MAVNSVPKITVRVRVRVRVSVLSIARAPPHALAQHPSSLTASALESERPAAAG